MICFFVAPVTAQNLHQPGSAVPVNDTGRSRGNFYATFQAVLVAEVLKYFLNKNSRNYLS
jgi:hypothetical protein